MLMIAGYAAYGRLWALLIAAVLLFWGGYVYIRYRAAKADAAAVFESRKSMVPAFDQAGEAAFTAAYLRVHGPRAAFFAFAATLTALAAMPLIFLLSTAVWEAVWHAAGRPPDLAEGLAPWLFAVALLMIASMVGVAAAFARLYHRNRPLSVEAEIARLKGNAA